ncbi:hypothetical protein ACI2LO_28375 [Streptomyces sp. NPDC033754]|uniref:hypothetical protein n=1 Tax=unclassified Streptomyces TaxID=2593676 RepID=UPI0033FC0F86
MAVPARTTRRGSTERGSGRGPGADADPEWTWGPLMTSTVTDLNDGLGKAWTGKGTIAQALSDAQDSTVAEMRKQGLAVAP